jgi:cellulose biosynthesis protein BcsQ
MIGTGKGGVGKSTIATHHAAWLAAQRLRTLLVCVTSQNDDDLGIERYGRGTLPPGDEVRDGQGLYQAVHDRQPLRPIQEVRPYLDVVPGGAAVSDLLVLLTARLTSEGVHVASSLARCLSPIAGRYDRIVLDSAPEQDNLEQLALAASRHLLVPTRSDDTSIRGINRIARNFVLVRRWVNPAIEVVGACLYGSNPSATQLHEEVRAEVREVLGPRIPMLSTVVGYRELPARTARKRGLLFPEYAALRPESSGRHTFVPESADRLAEDIDRLNHEIDHRCRGMSQ